MECYFPSWKIKKLPAPSILPFEIQFLPIPIKQNFSMWSNAPRHHAWARKCNTYGKVYSIFLNITESKISLRNGKMIIWSGTSASMEETHVFTLVQIEFGHRTWHYITSKFSVFSCNVNKWTTLRSHRKHYSWQEFLFVWPLVSHCHPLAMKILVFQLSSTLILTVSLTISVTLTLYAVKNPTDLFQIVNFTGLLQLINKWQSTCQFHQLATSL